MRGCTGMRYKHRITGNVITTDSVLTSPAWATLDNEPQKTTEPEQDAAPKAEPAAKPAAKPAARTPAKKPSGAANRKKR